MENVAATAEGGGAVIVAAVDAKGGGGGSGLALPSPLPKKEAPYCDVLSELPEVRLLSPPSSSLKEEALHHVALRRWRRSCGWTRSRSIANIAKGRQSNVVGGAFGMGGCVVAAKG